MIKKLSEREHILIRPSMYIGGISKVKKEEFIYENNKIIFKEINYVPGLIKIINEIIDNAVDEYIKTDGEFGNKIFVKITENQVQVKDNGRGIPVKKQGDHYLPELCWNHARAGSNFDDDDHTQIGTNGVGSFATAVFSEKFVGITDDGKKRYKIVIQNNAESFRESIQDSKERGTFVTFEPDLVKFGLENIDETHKNIIYQRLINLSITFPDIQFKFNGKVVQYKSFKKYLELFNEYYELFETDNYKFAILPNQFDDFKQFSYVNGLYIKNGGTHIDIITENVVRRLREKLQRKFKAIKPGDIKNKIMVVAFLKNVNALKFDSQTKETITNSVKEMNEYYGEIDWDKFVNKIYKNKEIIDPITEVYRIKEEFAKRKELQKLSKTRKKIKSEKYYPATRVKKYLMITEGESAFGGLSPVLGRSDTGYYCLKGKPLNAYSANTQKFTANKELTELFQILQNEGYEKIIFATDQDLDGFHIRGLLIGFIERYAYDYKGKIGILNTPVKAVSKNKKLIRWVYNLNDSLELKRGEELKYFKGLGRWNKNDLKAVVEKDGLEKMIDMFEFDNENIIDDWLNDKKADIRKTYIMNNDFDIVKV